MSAESKGFAVESADHGSSKGASATAVSNFDFSQVSAAAHSPVDSSLKLSSSSMEFGGWRASGLVDQMPELAGSSRGPLFGEAGTQSANALSSLVNADWQSIRQDVRQIINLVDGGYQSGGNHSVGGDAMPFSDRQGDASRRSDEHHDGEHHGDRGRDGDHNSNRAPAENNNGAYPPAAGDSNPAPAQPTPAAPVDNTAGGTTAPPENTGAPATTAPPDVPATTPAPSDTTTTGTGDSTVANTGATTDQMQQILSMINVAPGTDPSIVADVQSTIGSLPPIVLNALLADHPEIVVAQGAASGSFDPNSNVVNITSDGSITKEIAAHEFAHVWDSVSGITGAFGNGGAQWQQLAQQAFDQVNPNTLPLQIANVDPPFIDGVGSGDVMAEMTSYLTGNDQTGDGRTLAATYPTLANYLDQELGLSSSTPVA